MTSRREQSLTYAILGAFSLLAILPIVGILLTAVQKQGELAAFGTFDGVHLGNFADAWRDGNFGTYLRSSAIVAVLLTAVQRQGELAAFGTFDGVHLGNFADAWRDGNFGTYLRSSAIVAVAVVAAAVLLSILAGYAFGLMRFRGSEILFYVFLLGLMIPTEAIIVPLYYDFRDIGLVDTYWALILPQVGTSVAFGTFWMRAYFRSVPRSLVEAARIDGASSWFTLWRVLLPLAKPAVLTMTVLLSMWTWNEFLLALVMVTDEGLRTAPLGLSFFQGRNTSNLTLLAAGAVIVATPVVVLYVFLQRHFIRGMLSGAVKG